MGEVVNLNRFRKAKKKAEAVSQAEANRHLHGMTKAERQRVSAETTRASKVLDGSRLEKPVDGAADDTDDNGLTP